MRKGFEETPAPHRCKTPDPLTPRPNKAGFVGKKKAMYKFIITESDPWTDKLWKEFGAIMEYAFKFFKGDTHSLMELAVALDRAYRDKSSEFYPIYMDGSIEVHLKETVAITGMENLGAPMFTITK